MKLLLLAFIAVSMAACAKSSDAQQVAQSCGEKSFKSRWTHPNYLFVLDLRNTVFDIEQDVTLVVNSTSCPGKMLFSGNECGGTYRFSGFTGACEATNSEGVFTKNERGLTTQSTTRNVTTTWQ